MFIEMKNDVNMKMLHDANYPRYIAWQISITPEKNCQVYCFIQPTLQSPLHTFYSPHLFWSHLFHLSLILAMETTVK